MHEGIWIPSPNMWQGRNGHSPKWIVLHGTAGGSSAQNVAAWFQNPQAQASTHYIVGQDGTIVSCVDEDDTPWANGIVTAGADPWWLPLDNPNYWTLSIEHVKPSTDNSDELTPAQQEASFALVERLCKRHSIPMRRADQDGGITGHYSVDPVNRSRCPGPYPWNTLFAFLTGPTNWQIKSATDEWLSSAIGKTLPMTTGIALSWMTRTCKGQRAGPPQEAEWHGNDFNGASIVVQRFAFARAEWQNGAARWFDARGEIV